MEFKHPSNLRDLLFHEMIMEAAKLNPKYPYMFTLDSDVPDAKIQTITFEQFVTDVARVAKALQQSAPRRRFGTSAQNVGILARSTYSYAVHWIACQFNGWIVSARYHIWCLRGIKVNRSAYFDFYEE